ncbi:hypothetical protein [Helicobacter sp. T3_23-1059]
MAFSYANTPPPLFVKSLEVIVRAFAMFGNNASDKASEVLTRDLRERERESCAKS